MESSEMSECWRIHNFDQRASIIVFRDPALPVPLKLHQRGAASEGFVQGTSSVAWPVSERMARYLCRHPELVQGKHVVELGAGLGLVGAVAAALGAQRVVLSDCEGALPLLEKNRAQLAEDGVTVEIRRIDWGSDSDHAAALSWEGRSGFDVVLASDVVVPGFHTDRLLASFVALCCRDAAARLLLGYEFRDEWGTVGHFIDGAEALGLECRHEALRPSLTAASAASAASATVPTVPTVSAAGAVATPTCDEAAASHGEDEDADEDDDDDMLLYTFWWRQPS